MIKSAKKAVKNLMRVLLKSRYSLKNPTRTFFKRRYLLKNPTRMLLKSRYSYFTLGNWTAYLLQLLMTFLLTQFLGWWYMLSYATALFIGTIILFFYHEMVTFKVRHPIFKEKRTKLLLKFLIWAGLLIVVSWILVFILAHIIGVYYLLAIILTGPVLSLFNYYVNKKWVFEGWKPKRTPKRNRWSMIKNFKINK